MAHISYGGVEYGKPNMAALEGDWGREIFERIASTPRLDYERLRRERDATVERARKELADAHR